MLKTKKLGTKKLVAAASSLALIGGLAVASPVSANGGDKQVSTASLDWKFSTQAFPGGHFDQFDFTGNVSQGSNAYQFTGGTGTVNQDSGEYNLQFTGDVRLSFWAKAYNINKEQYALTISNPTLVSNANGATLKADVSYDIPEGSNQGQPVPAQSDSQNDVTMVSLPDAPKANSQGVNLVDVQPELGPGWNEEPDVPSFNAEFIDFLPQVLKGNFTQTGNSGTGAPTSSNPKKVPAPVSAEAKLWDPKLELVGATGIPLNKSKTITVKGSGFDPSLRAEGLYVVFGPKAPQVQPPYPAGAESEQDNFYSAVPLLDMFGVVAPDSQGKFQTTIKVAGLYKDNKGRTIDSRKTALGVSVWAAHSNAVPAYRQWAQVGFAQGAVSYSKPGKVKSAKRAKTTKKATKLTWKAPTATKTEFRNNAATYYQVRATNKKGKKYGKWVKVSSRSYTFKKLSKKGSWKFQIRAVGKAGAGSVVTLKLNRR